MSIKMYVFALFFIKDIVSVSLLTLSSHDDIISVLDKSGSFRASGLGPHCFPPSGTPRLIPSLTPTHPRLLCCTPGCSLCSSIRGLLVLQLFHASEVGLLKLMNKSEGGPVRVEFQIHSGYIFSIRISQILRGTYLYYENFILSVSEIQI